MPRTNRPLRPAPEAAPTAAPAPAKGARRIAAPLLLSLLIPGLGQLYNGQKAKGLAILAVVGLIVAAQVGAMVAGNLATVALVGTACTVLLGVLGVAAAADAGYRASRS